MSISAAITGLELVISNILQQHPGRMPFCAAARIIGYPTTASAHTARARGTFPIRTRAECSRLVVFTSDLVEYLQSGKSQARLSCASIKKSFKVKTGRPGKREQLEAARRGLSVKELRAQRSLHLQIQIGGLEGGAK